MATRDQLIEQIKRQELINQIEALQSQPDDGLTGMEMAAQFGRGAVPFANEVRGAIDATATKVFGDDPASWSELQGLYSGDQDAEADRVYEENPGLAMALEAAGGVTSLMTGGGAAANMAGKAGARHMAREAAERTAAKPRLRVPAQAAKPRVRVEATTQQIRNPQYSVRVPATISEVATETTLRAPGKMRGLVSATAQVAGATAVGGPLLGVGLAAAKTNLGRKMIFKGARVINEDFGNFMKHIMDPSNKKWLKDAYEATKRGKE